jgi:hypothetical protein
VQQAEYRKKMGEEFAETILTDAKSALMKKRILIDNEEARKRNEERNRKIREEKAAKGEVEESAFTEGDEGGMWGKGSEI